MRCQEAQELITALVDNELSAEERIAIENHLPECHDCRTQLERETALKRDLKLASAAVTMPQGLRAKIESMADKSDSDNRAAKGISNRGWLTFPRLRPAWAFAILALAIAAVLYQARPQQDVIATALATHASLMSGQENLARTNDPAELRKRLAFAVNNRFAPVVLDLSMVKLYPVAGFVKKIGDRDVLVTVYEGDGPSITCFTFLGTQADAPKNAELFRDEEMRVDFYIFSRDNMNGVMHQEGEVICILIAKMAPAELLDLIRGKAHHA